MFGVQAEYQPDQTIQFVYVQKIIIMGTYHASRDKTNNCLITITLKKSSL